MPSPEALELRFHSLDSFSPELGQSRPRLAGSSVELFQETAAGRLDLEPFGIREESGPDLVVVMLQVGAVYERRLPLPALDLVANQRLESIGFFGIAGGLAALSSRGGPDVEMNLLCD